ncbi:hypothetical protein SLS53_005966 [Cytospora paraplurivora]|uniref:Uncharacterized protein n=1 Tax=Cytospora paraplurivora TaxID=2898453 RepID=A0AAN9U4Y6_9PEZI
MPAALSTGQQVMLRMLLMSGNPILTSILALAFRMCVFERRFKDIIKAERELEMILIGAVVVQVSHEHGGKDGRMRPAYLGRARDKAGNFSRDDVQYEFTSSI